jgi:hypothetical protein
MSLRTGEHLVLRVAAAVAQPAPGSAGSPDEQPGAEESDEPVDGGVAVIPPGQDELAADMLGRGVALPGPCSFAGAEANGTLIRSTYACPTGSVVFELRHVDAAPPGAARTKQFALILQSGAAPDGLTDALLTRIRDREAGFRWKWLAGPGTRFPRRTIKLAAAGLAGVVVLAWVFRRWLLARRRQPG